MIECTCAREKILTICDSKKINILKKNITYLLFSTKYIIMPFFKKSVNK